MGTIILSYLFLMACGLVLCAVAHQLERHEPEIMIAPTYTDGISDLCVRQGFTPRDQSDVTFHIDHCSECQKGCA